ncbi:MAG: porin family protein [Gammaproteobacteria bacterium]|nr:porin family protein [Gammaproteobacteria bacterium]
MKKRSLVLAITFFYSGFTFAASIQTINPGSNWTGFYLGGNVGYWRHQNNDITSTGSVNFISQIYVPGASDVADALAQMANNNSSLDSYGAISGVQAGYNYKFSKDFLVGLNIDFDGLSNTDNNATLQKTADLVDYDESYTGSLTVKQKINYVGTLRARLGYLYNPTFLLYVSGGFAYGNVTLNTTWTAQESLGAAVFPAINTQNNANKTLPGWTAGAGVEWLFKPNWSAMLEYSYYSLNDFNVSATLPQTNAGISPPVVWASANANTAVSLSVWAIRMGLNYHFL